uniref:DUF3078 domain-containing protein n=1 Tax=uncultured bacterium 34R1 TaxID=581113 RepID=C0K031_9BACT|nr:hypothetical protein BVU_3352 [uncultured bacterium 34R1]
MKRFKTLLLALFTVGSVLMPQVVVAQSADSIQASTLLMPLIFERQQTPDSLLTAPQLGASAAAEGLHLGVENAWLKEAQTKRQRENALRYGAMIENPQLVKYNMATLPEPPEEYAVGADLAKNRLVITPVETEPVTVEVEKVDIKPHNWLHTFKGSLHFTQAYVSDNWYQGGENNINVLGDIQWDCNLNQVLHPKWLFNNSLQYKLGVMTAHNDSLRHYAINEDNFQFSFQLGYKAVKNWYYSATLLFKTQLFNNYKSNTNTMTASFLSPAELNVGLGMTYNYKDKYETKVFTLSIAPLSYNLKICRDIDRLDPTTFGIDAGHHTKHSFGSTVEAKLNWKISNSITWESRFYAFTNYEYVQGDWENTFDFSITRHLNTKFYVHLRYDKSRPWHADWKYWQLKEILSLGLTYRFSTN